VEAVVHLARGLHGALELAPRRLAIAHALGLAQRGPSGAEAGLRVLVLPERLEGLLGLGDGALRVLRQLSAAVLAGFGLGGDRVDDGGARGPIALPGGPAPLGQGPGGVQRDLGLVDRPRDLGREALDLDLEGAERRSARVDRRRRRHHRGRRIVDHGRVGRRAGELVARGLERLGHGVAQRREPRVFGLGAEEVGERDLDGEVLLDVGQVRGPVGDELGEAAARRPADRVLELADPRPGPRALLRERGQHRREQGRQATGQGAEAVGRLARADLIEQVGARVDRQPAAQLRGDEAGHEQVRRDELGLAVEPLGREVPQAVGARDLAFVLLERHAVERRQAVPEDRHAAVGGHEQPPRVEGAVRHHAAIRARLGGGDQDRGRPREELERRALTGAALFGEHGDELAGGPGGVRGRVHEHAVAGALEAAQPLDHGELEEVPDRLQTRAQRGVRAHPVVVAQRHEPPAGTVVELHEVGERAADDASPVVELVEPRHACQPH
jgi:hypothetical protein